MASIEKRTTQNNEIAYRVKVRLKGFPIQTATFSRLTDARKWAQHTESAIREGRYFKTSEARKHTLAETIDRYCEQVLPTKPKSAKDQTTQLQWWKQAIGCQVLADITPALVAKCRDDLFKGKTTRGEERRPSTVNRYLAALSHVFTVALKEWGWVNDNPVLKISKPKEDRGRSRFLSDNERARLLQACRESSNGWLELIVTLCLSTGARKMEIIGLRWPDVDLDRGVITLHQTKNGERRVLPLVSHAHTMMQAHAKVRHLHCEWVFPSNKADKPIEIRKPWEVAIEKAEIKDFRFHDLRHSAASYLAMNGASLAEIAEILGHKTLQMVKRYAHLSEAHTSKVVERMNQKIFS
jgi:integrase